MLVDLDGAVSPDAVVTQVLANRAWAGDHRSVAYFVRGGSGEQAAAVVGALSALGVAPVFLVAG